MRALRQQGIFDPDDVETAIIETDGKISVMERNKESKQKTSETKYGVLPDGFKKLVGQELIINGKVIKETLAESDISVDWLDSALIDQGLKLEDVVVALITPDGKLYIDKKDD